jgi:hypothetical protein
MAGGGGVVAHAASSAVTPRKPMRLISHSFWINVPLDNEAVPQPFHARVAN